MNEPDPFDFGVTAMCAALVMHEEDFREAYRRGDICLPDGVRFGGPRWSPQSLRNELIKRHPPDPASMMAEVEAMLKVERAFEYAKSIERCEREQRARGAA